MTYSGYNIDKNINWGVHKLYKEMYDALWDKVPAMGEIKGKENKKLERYRKASQVIYDIFNNGLMNRGNQLRVLGLKRHELSLPNNYCQPNWDYNEEVIWEKFKPILIEATVEQLNKGRK